MIDVHLNMHTVALRRNFCSKLFGQLCSQLFDQVQCPFILYTYLIGKAHNEFR